MLSRLSRRLTAAAILFFAAAFPCAAQTIGCTGPTGSNCIPVVQMQTAAGQAGYPGNSTPITASATGSTGAIAATLTGAAAKTTYLCGFNYQGSDATAAVVGNIAVTGTITGTMNFGYAALALGATVPQPPPNAQVFTPCIPSSAVNTSIVVTPPTLGAGATIATVSAWGYLQ